LHRSRQPSRSPSSTRERRASDLRAFEDGYYPFLDSAHPDILADITKKKALDDDIRKRLTDAINEYKQDFLAARKEAATTTVTA